MHNKTLKIFQSGFNFSQDGPGNRLVIHLQGCNMKCPWCSNPEGMNPLGTIIIDEKHLQDDMCPYDGIVDKKRYTAKCDTCLDKVCVSARSRNQGIKLSYEEITIEDLLTRILDCRELFFDGGGVTFSGGEPTLQFEPLHYLMKKLKEEKINITIETNGSSKRLAELFPLIDHLIIDFKIPIAERHREFTGISDRQTRINIKLASETHGDILIRTPLIHGYNDSQEDLEAFLEFYNTCNKKNMKFEFMAYHEYGKTKWQQCGLEYKMPDDAYISEETLQIFITTFKNNGLKVVHT